ncbi:hypothetical protein BHM03_00007243 [Ensete ventricosum]|uniref:Uncharacterized protein n=1 Tax=Ensete ventricosum TaxID=4639 RepID=A0A445MBY7_ENSVE|nr:hypothetical protein BHM03_00007243 [Ensete ventricosum]
MVETSDRARTDEPPEYLSDRRVRAADRWRRRSRRTLEGDRRWDMTASRTGTRLGSCPSTPDLVVRGDVRKDSVFALFQF